MKIRAGRDCFTSGVAWSRNTFRRLFGMEDLVQHSIGQIRLAHKHDVPWKTDEPWEQDYYVHDGHWKPAGQHPHTSEASTMVTSLTVHSWNIDFMLPFSDSRMSAALDYLHQTINGYVENVRSIVFLQECTQSDLELLARHEWVQKNFYLSDLDTTNWSSTHYGTVTLIDRRLIIARSFRVHYDKTRMERDAFFTDVCIGDQGLVVRLCNSHLESMAFEPAMRPHQLALASKYMHEMTAAVIAGDFNAIQDFDRQLHSDNNLKDAYLELGGKDDGDAGYTWGQQAATYQRERFGLCRMDKVFYCGALRLKSFEVFGADVMVTAEDEKAKIIALGFDKPWITDHLGVKATFELASI